MKKYWELTKNLPNQLNQKIINEFLLSLKLANRSKSTIISYRPVLEHFFSDFTDPFSSITSDAILNWLHTHQSHVKETTLSFRISVLSSFYNFSVLEEYILKSPIKSRWYPRLPKPVPKYLEKEDIAKTRLQTEKISTRNQLIVEFMLTSGCRIGEVHLLNWEDVDLENRTARVVGKGKKIRNVHFTDKCAVLFERYFNSHSYNSGAVFVSTTGRRLSTRRIYEIIIKIGEMALLSTRLHSHRFRHTFATELLSKGADLSFIADELGHDDLGTTQIYARLPKTEVVSLYRKYMG